MNHLRWILRDSSSKHGNRRNMDSKQMQKQQQQQRGRNKPKLERRNASKNINYDPSSSEESSSSLRTRSLDISPYSDDRTSFRIGGIDGEIERICLSLGLSGPDDLAISAAAWEISKARSRSDCSLLRAQLTSNDVDSFGSVVDDVPRKLEEDRLSRRFDAAVRVGDCASGSGGAVELSSSPKSLSSSSSAAVVVSTARLNGGGGIKGVRPPALAPPPSMTLPDLGNVGSTWDILKAFAPEGNNQISFSKVREEDTSSSDEEEDEDEDEETDEYEIEDGEIGGGIGQIEDVDGVRLGETATSSESCSFTTSNDDDSSSTNTDPTYIISPNARFRCKIRSWSKGSLLGSGSFGTVYEGFSEDGFFFAVKEVSLLDQGRQAQQSISQLEQEIALLSQFDHENIVRYLGTDKDDKKLYIFLELVTKGSLAQLYQKYHLRDSQVSAYTRQILQGLKYLHDRQVVHRDIKCANILVDANGSVKLADFGLAKATKLNDVKSCKGTAFWMAPEVVNLKNRGYGLAADIWSLGCTVLEMLTRQLPYFHLESMQALFRIGKGERPHVPDSLSSDARDFIFKCLQVNPDDRPTAAQLLDHSFVKRPLSSPSESVSPHQIT